jgi:hypothetical protein
MPQTKVYLEADSQDRQGYTRVGVLVYRGLLREFS